MLQALLHKKMECFLEHGFKDTEDSKTSSVIGLMQYLPSNIIWDLLRKSCGEQSNLPDTAGELLSIEFWPRWAPDGETNTRHVEPDVFCEFEQFDLIIEAKKYDGGGQDKGQWKKEILSYLEEQPTAENKSLKFIAFGGNESLKDCEITVKDKKYIIHTASWQNLLNAVKKHCNKPQSITEKRLLSDIILAFERHNYFCLEWLSSLTPKEINHKNIEIISRWKFDNKAMLQNFSNINIKSKSIKILELWTTH
jgi:hypothetical protein